VDRRIESAKKLGGEVNAWQTSPNTTDSQINGQCTMEDARIKLRRLYPEYLRQDAGQLPSAPAAIHN